MENISVTWRGKKFILPMMPESTFKQLGDELLKLTDVKADTIRLIVPHSSNKGSTLIYPFSEEHSSCSLRELFLLEQKSVKMMGVPKGEVDELLQNAKVDLRIAGFDEEEKRQRQRVSGGPSTSLKLPQGTYVFCDFRTLHLPGIEPPASEALALMHRLAADPGIVAIMNKHHWRVGIMTEMAPVGYVGVSPKCILGFNKNNGEEISLRLRTDDLKGFRKYDSIKKTLLHELAHMVYSEHDANFYAFDKQLNQEAAALDWTRSRSHTSGGFRHVKHYQEEVYVDSHATTTAHKIGGKSSNLLGNAREASVSAAYHRWTSFDTSTLVESVMHEEPDPDDAVLHGPHLTLHTKTMENALNPIYSNISQWKVKYEPDPDPDQSCRSPNNVEPDPDDSVACEPMEAEPYANSFGNITMEPYPDDSEDVRIVSNLETDQTLETIGKCDEPDPDDSESYLKGRRMIELDHVDMIENLKCRVGAMEKQTPIGNVCCEPVHHDSQEGGAMVAEPDPDDTMPALEKVSQSKADEPNQDDQELKRIKDPVTIFCDRLQKAIDMLRSEVSSTEAAATVLQTLFKIIRNVIEHPGELKFKRLRKANPIIQRTLANYRAAMEILFMIGFIEDVAPNEIGREETYLILRRNDPGLLWLAKCSLEACIAF